MGEGRAIGAAKSEQKSGQNILKKLTGENKTNQENINRQTTGKIRKCHHQEIPIRDGKRKMRR